MYMIKYEITNCVTQNYSIREDRQQKYYKTYTKLQYTTVRHKLQYTTVRHATVKLQ